MNRDELVVVLHDIDTKAGGYIKYSELAALALEIALPAIEADLRERIAQEIEASASINECVEGSKPNDYRTGLLTAAALVRGTSTTDTGNDGS